MTRLRDLDLSVHLADPARKQQFVTPMFDLIASRYDAFTRVFSFGMDRRWKRLVLRELRARVSAARNILDVACGTGDLAFGAQSVLPDSFVTGFDASPQMIALARARAELNPPQTRFAIGDLTRLDIADRSADAVTAGYAFRNVPDHRAALREVARVLRPGGVLVTLDFYRPESRLWRALFLGYLRAAGNLVGWWWHREPVAYGYIGPSINAWVSARTFRECLDAAGFDVQAQHTFLLGGVAVHVAQRRA